MLEKSFGRFYLERIALSEGCGCAEKFIGTRGIDPQAREMPLRHAKRSDGGGLLAWLGRLFRGGGWTRTKTARM